MLSGKPKQIHLYVKHSVAHSATVLVAECALEVGRHLPRGVYQNISDNALLAVICCMGVGGSPLQLDELALKMCIGLNSSPGI